MRYLTSVVRVVGLNLVADAERDHPGTTVTLHLKPADPEHGFADYADDVVIARSVKHYFDFVAYPIRMRRWKPGSTGTAKTLEDETLNSMKAIWDRAKGEVSVQAVLSSHLSRLERSAALDPDQDRGTYEANALLYIPT